MKLSFSLQGVDDELLEWADWTAQDGRMQWRGSHDGIIWGSWLPMTHFRMLLPGGPYFAVQARAWGGVGWCNSPIEV